MSRSASKTIWFKRKQYGWGWYPATWQGGAITIGYMGLAIGLGFAGDSSAEAIVSRLVPNLTHEAAAMVGELAIVGLIFCLSIGLVAVCYRFGESPRWQWGGEPKK